MVTAASPPTAIPPGMAPTPAAPLWATTLPTPGPAPPIVIPVPAMALIPPPMFPRALDSAASVPMKFPCRTYGELLVER